MVFVVPFFAAVTRLGWGDRVERFHQDEAKSDTFSVSSVTLSLPRARISRRYESDAVLSCRPACPFPSAPSCDRRQPACA